SDFKVPNIIFYFFFSSRRRHTRFSRDWSSDVCSSDLVGVEAARQRVRGDGDQALGQLDHRRVGKAAQYHMLEGVELLLDPLIDEIGRASCRERVKIHGVIVLINN